MYEWYVLYVTIPEVNITDARSRLADIVREDVVTIWRSAIEARSIGDVR
jgi:hypothetical protein